MNIKEMITNALINALINDNPVLKLNIHILLISNEYLQIFSFLYFVFSSFN